MRDKELKRVFELAKKIQEEADTQFFPPQEIIPTRRNDVLVHSLFENTRGYIEKIVFQINKSYEQGCYDACAVMIRRLIEVLIIETFDAKNIAHKIKDKDDNYFFLENLINKTLCEASLNLSRITKQALGRKKFKKIGDRSAHSRRYNACRDYIDDLKMDLSLFTQDLLYLSGLKR